MSLAHFRYEPLVTDGNGSLDVLAYDQYVLQSFWPSLLERIVLEPVDRAIKDSGHAEFKFPDFKVRVEPPRRSISWSDIYQKLLTFLEIRSDDSRKGVFPDLKYEEGLGYSISIDALLEQMQGLIDDATSISSEPRIVWPPIRKTEEPVRNIIIPNTNYSKIVRETGLVAMQARRFRKGLTDEVINAYKRANEVWLRDKTGYDRENIPPEDESPIKRTRHIGDLKYVFITLVREDKHDYSSIIETLLADLRVMKEGERGELWKIYMPTADGSVNIKRLLERLRSLYNSTDNPRIVNPDVRYTIVP